MKKIVYLINMIFFGLLWLYVLYGFIFRHKVISTIICMFILVPPTFGIVRAYLIARKDEADEKRRSENRYMNQMPTNQRPMNQMPMNQVPQGGASSGRCFCTSCGTLNDADSSFCVGCGKPL